MRSMGRASGAGDRNGFFCREGLRNLPGDRPSGDERAIFEYLPVDDGIRREIMAKSSTERIKDVAIEKGMTVLRQDGWCKVREGITTIAEVLRVTLEK